jgi:hypothetical protein
MGFELKRREDVPNLVPVSRRNEMLQGPRRRRRRRMKPLLVLSPILLINLIL